MSSQLEGMGKLGEEQLQWLKDDLSGAISERADRGVRAYPAVDGVSGMGMGTKRTASRRWSYC